MIAIAVVEADFPAGMIPMKQVTAVIYHTGSGQCAVTYADFNGAKVTKWISGQQGADLYNAIVALNLITPTTAT